MLFVNLVCFIKVEMNVFIDGYIISMYIVYMYYIFRRIGSYLDKKRFLNKVVGFLNFILVFLLFLIMCFIKICIL